MPAPIPKATTNIRNGGLAIIAAALAGVTFIVGTSSAGVAGQFYTYEGDNVQQVLTDLGTGPLPDQVVKHLTKSNGKRVYAYKSSATTAGSSSTVTQVGGGPAVTLTGVPYDQSETIIKIVTGGVVGSSAFQYSLDGGDTWSAILATAATVLLPNGVTANFAAGTYVVNTTYSWTDTAPAMNSTDIGNAYDAIIVSPYAGEFIHFLGHPATAADSLTIATLLATKRASAYAAKKYLIPFFEGPAVDKASIISTFVAYTDMGVVGCAGFAEIVSDVSSRVHKRSSGRVIVPRCARQPRAIQPIRTVADTKPDPLPDVRLLVPTGAAASTGYHDEAATPGLNDAKWSTLMTIAGRPEGFYICNVNTFDGPTGDFQSLPYLRIVLAGAGVWDQYAIDQLGRRVRVDKKTGYILPRFADALDKGGAAAIRAVLGDDIEDVVVLVGRSTKITQTRKLTATIRMVVGGYIFEIEGDVGLADSLPSAAAA